MIQGHGMVCQRNEWIPTQSGSWILFIHQVPSDLWIICPDLDHPKGTHPKTKDENHKIEPKRKTNNQSVREFIKKPNSSGREPYFYFGIWKSSHQKRKFSKFVSFFIWTVCDEFYVYLVYLFHWLRRQGLTDINSGTRFCGSCVYVSARQKYSKFLLNIMLVESVIFNQ